jgi:hypothetical protein
MRTLILTALLIVLSVQLFAQKEEHWETYMAEIEHKPASILVDMTPYEQGPNKLLPYLLICGPKYIKLQNNGLPGFDQIPELEKMLDAGDKILTGVTSKILLGTFTYNGERLNYYYIKDTAEIAKALGRLYKRKYPEAEYICKMKYDPTWSAYREFLYPSEKNLNWIQNNKIINGLLQQGDSLKKPRDISFIWLFENESDRKKFSDFALSKHYQLQETKYMSKADFHYMLKLSVFSSVTPEAIDQITTELKTETLKYKAQYLGWMCKAITD